MSPRNGLHDNVIKIFHRNTVTGQSETDIVAMIHELHRERHHEKDLIYCDFNAVINKLQEMKLTGKRQSPFDPSAAKLPPIPPQFPSFDEATSHAPKLPSRSYLSNMVDDMWEDDSLEDYLELLVERVKAVDLQLDHTFLLCKYIALGRTPAFIALLKIVDARTGEYVGFFFVQSTSLDEGTILSDLKERLGEIGIVSTDNAAGSCTTVRNKLGAKYALRDIFHIMQLVVESTTPGHVLRPMLSTALSLTFYQLDPEDKIAYKAKCDQKGKEMTAKAVKEARRRGEVRAYVSGENLTERFKTQMQWIQIEHRNGPNFGHYNFKLVDKLKQRYVHFGYKDTALQEWEPPTGKPKYKLGIKALEVTIPTQAPMAAEDGRNEDAEGVDDNNAANDDDGDDVAVREDLEGDGDDVDEWFYDLQSSLDSVALRGVTQDQTDALEAHREAMQTKMEALVSHPQQAMASPSPTPCAQAAIMIPASLSQPPQEQQEQVQGFEHAQAPHHQHQQEQQLQQQAPFGGLQPSQPPLRPQQ
ncbi:hypothetical protein CYMTET_52663, partial [Cymbomonas tetramitiformis]